MTRRYISSDELAPAEIRAAIDSGELRPWRRDSSGAQWYERADALPVIHGIGPSPEEAAEDRAMILAQELLEAELAEVTPQSFEEMFDEASLDAELQASRDRFEAFLRGELSECEDE